MDWKKPRGFKVEEMLYPDRCMLKWHGMLLSDHTERISSDKAAENLMLETMEAFEYVDRSSWDMLLKRSIEERIPLDITVSRDLTSKETISGIPQNRDGRYITFIDRKGGIHRFSRMEIKRIEESD